MEPLASLLEQHRLDAMLREANIIRDYPDCQERLDEARKMIRFVLYEFALGKVSPADRDRILNALDFAAECLTVVHQHPVPAYQDDHR